MLEKKGRLDTRELRDMPEQQDARGEGGIREKEGRLDARELGDTYAKARI